MFVDGLAQSAKIRFEVIDGSEDSLLRSVVKLGLSSILLSLALQARIVLRIRLARSAPPAMEGGSMRHSSVKYSLLGICLVRAELLLKDIGKLSKQSIKIDVNFDFDIAVAFS